VSRLEPPTALSLLDAAGLWLSPHFDDVALSCGGAVALVADRGHPATMVTLFGGEITDELTTDFAGVTYERLPRRSRIPGGVNSAGARASRPVLASGTAWSESR